MQSSLDMNMQRQSTSSILSLSEPMNTDLSILSLSDNEQKALLAALRKTYDMYFQKQSFEFLPTCYYAIMEELWKSCSFSQFITSDLISLLVTLLECIQVRLFQYILSKYYEEFTHTDLFEYLNHEQIAETPSLSLQKIYRLSRYSSSRLQNCMIEMPYLKKLIVEYSENAEELLAVGMNRAM